MGVELFEHQKEALERMKNGCILCGGVGSGKSITSIAYYFTQCGGKLSDNYNEMEPMSEPLDLYIITTARKRDTKEWESELIHFDMSTYDQYNIYENKVIVDSWNNIKKYVGVKNAFFIFDEQRVVGTGTWVKAFLRIVRDNKWILLSATPGDTWMDYVPVFVANGFFRNPSQFKHEHVVYSQYCTKYPKIDRYVDTGRLIRLRNNILVDMDFTRPTTSHNIDIWVDWDKVAFKSLMKTRWNAEKNEPIQNSAELCYEMRKIVNSDSSRLDAVWSILSEKKKAIIFYNFDYELEMLKCMLDHYNYIYAEWNGHKHQEIPEGDKWAYLVQYNAGAEGWNCIRTDTIIFYSQNYSYKVMVQSSGRIDRLNTPFKNLYYYHLKSHSGIDLAIATALKNKKKFNEAKYIGNIS